MKTSAPRMPWRTLLRRPVAWLSLAAALWGWSLGAQAAGLQVSPILLDFSAAESAQGVWLSNTGDAPLRAQVRVQQWTQAEGRDQLAPTRDLVASPPVLEIAPGQRQMVRVVRLQAGAPAQELAYRLLIDELPSDRSAAGAAAATGLQMLLRYSVPVFIAGGTAQPAPPARAATDLSTLSVSTEVSGDGLLLQVRNTGARRVRLSQLSFVEGAGGEPVPLVPGLVGYVLAGRQMQWPVQLSPERLRNDGAFRVRIDNDQEERTLPLLRDRR